MPRPISLKTLKLSLDGTDDIECQLTRAAIVDNPDTEDLTTFCGTVTSSTSRYTMELSGFQDWGGEEGPPVVDAICDMLHQSYKSYQTDAVPDAPVEAVLQVGQQTRTCDVKPQNDMTFGGDAGSALTFDVTLDVLGEITEGVLP